MTATLLITAPTRSVPLAIQTERHGKVIHNAVGFGSAPDAAAAARVADAIQKASADLLANAAKFVATPNSPSNGRDGNMVTLRGPDMDRVRMAGGPEARNLTPEAVLTLVSGRLMSLLDASSLQEMKQRLSSFQARMAIRAGQSEQLSAALEAALEAAEDAGSAAEAAAAEAGAQEGAVRVAREDVERLQAELEGLQPDDPAYAEKQAALASAQQVLKQAESRLEQATDTLLAAGAAFSSALQQLQQQREVVGGFSMHVVRAAKPEEREINAAATLQKLLARLSILGAEVSLDRLKNETAALRAALEAREAENLERSRKYEAEQQRARDAEKKTGCAGKILNWVSAAVSVVVTVVGVLTFNPAIIAVGVVGMLMTIDSMVGSVTGFSIMGKLTELVSSGISSALKAFGVSESLASQIADIAAVVVVAVLAIAMTMMAGNVGGALQAVGAAQNITRMMDTARKAVEVLQAMGQLISAAAGITVGVGQIIVADIMIDVAKLLAAMEESIFGSEVIRDLIDKVRESADAMYRTALDLIRQMGDVIQDNAETGKAIIAHTRGHA